MIPYLITKVFHSQRKTATMTHMEVTALSAFMVRGGTAPHNSNLNGGYLHGTHASHANGVNWETWKGDNYSAKRAEMKIRPTDWIPS